MPVPFLSITWIATGCASLTKRATSASMTCSASGGAIILIEWPERAGAWAPPLDRHFQLSYDDDPARRVVEEMATA